MIFAEEKEYKKSIGIYRIRNLITNKVYVGQTTENFQRRYWLHRWQLRKNKHDNNHLQRAWNKYGEENFIFEVIEVVNKEEIDEKERYWIAFYRNSSYGCYSIQDGGQDKRLGRCLSAEARKKIGELNRVRMLGSKLPDETKRKMSESRKGKRIYRKNDRLTDEQAFLIKSMYVSGKTSKEIQDELKIPYKILNNILSMNSYSTIKVEGWEDFFKERLKCREYRKNRGKLIEEELIEGKPIKELSLKYGVNRKTIEYYKKKLNKRQDNSVPSP